MTRHLYVDYGPRRPIQIPTEYQRLKERPGIFRSVRDVFLFILQMFALMVIVWGCIWFVLAIGAVTDPPQRKPQRGSAGVSCGAMNVWEVSPEGGLDVKQFYGDH